MSQVRKLLKGNLVPKAQQGYKFKLDSQEYNVTEDQLKEIDNQIALLDPQHRRFLGNWTNAIKSGNSSGNRASNTVTINMISGVDGKDVDRLKKQKGSFWESFAPKDSYYAKEAINQALTITASVLANTPAKKSEEASKTKIEKSLIDLDFNEKGGKKYLSPTSEQNMSARKRVSDLIAHLQAGNNSTYDYSAYNTDAISSWLNGLEGDNKYKAGNDYFNNLWTAMGNSNYAYDPDVDDLLKMFGINYGLTAPAGSTTGSGSIGSGTVSSGATGASTGNTKVGDIITVLDKDYKVTGFKDNGDPILEEVTNTEETENTEDEEAIETEPAQAQSLVLIKPGDRDDMDWGVYYNGKAYSYESIQPGSELSNLMAKFEENNRKMLKQGERYNANSFIQLPSIKNFADWTVGQTLDDGTDLNSFFLNRGITSAALSHMATDANGNRYFKYYNNYDPSGTYIPSNGNTPKETPWGIRSPYYLMIDKDGNIIALSSSPTKDELGQDVVINNAAPKIKDLPWNPTSSAEIANVNTNTGFNATIPDINKSKIPATFVQTININNKIYNLYKLQSGEFYIQSPTRFGTSQVITPEQLYTLLSRQKKKAAKKAQGGTISKSKTDSFKSKFGNVVKGQDGLVAPEWEAYKKRNLLTANIPTTTVTIDGKPQTIIQKPVGMRLESGLKNPSAYTISNNDDIRRTSSVVSSDEEYDEIGGYPMNIQDRSKHLIPLISLIRFGINANLQRKYRDTAKKAIEAGRFNEQPVVLNTPRNDNPALDRALQQIQSERMAGVKPVTSDLIANNAILNQREAQLWDREQNIIGQRSQADWEAKKEALNIMNQNIVNQTTTANSNRARNAAINSALYNPELEFIQRRGQSIENLGLEIQNNIKQDRNVILNHQRDLELQKETNILNNKLDAMFPGGRRAYDLLSDDEKLNYTDYADFLRKKYPEKWNANIDTINRLQSAYANNVRAWMYENGLNYSYPTFLTGRQSPIGYKKGGYLKGSTRYTMEPDERIWVDNNKATHAAISKLSESTIKLLLRALK